MMVMGDIVILIVLLMMLFFIIGVAIFLVLWTKSSYRKKDQQIKELQKEIEELKKSK
ncbi:lipopolysaccharide assembly protein LapA domain-containing protein [Bacillus alkalicellulosilyticus]|uniref:lipopolysaccharide assembly protein LapA domain-containing protein n=1 Tax=Alkalihalobacterium alkalicellulosilyticum TaxID=1912214 RepID=UPI001482011E|nr:lipopolysaccharide assembly protein LapA domain-containing protein [Bacillus alkalicellulosilyticus]